MTAVFMARKEQFPADRGVVRAESRGDARAPLPRPRRAAVDEHARRRVEVRRVERHLARRPARGARPRRAPPAPAPIAASAPSRSRARARRCARRSKRSSSKRPRACATLSRARPRHAVPHPAQDRARRTRPRFRMVTCASSTEHEYAVVAAAADRLIPPLDAHPGGAALGVADYVDSLLGAFTFDPPLIFAGGPFSGRAGGDASFARVPAALAPRRARVAHAHRRLARHRRTRVQRPGTRLAGDLPRRHRRARRRLLRRSTATSRTAGSRAQARAARGCSTSTRAKARTARPSTAATATSRAGASIEFPGDVQPRGYTDDEVSRPCLSRDCDAVIVGTGPRARPRPTCSPARAGR